MPTIAHDGRSIHYEEAGGGPVAVLLPPGASPAAIWRGVTAALGGRMRTLAVDLTGYGRTSPWDQPHPMSIDDEAAAVEAVIRHGLGQGAGGGAVTLVGHSYGGAIAVRLALAQPGLVRRLVLIEPALYPILAQSGAGDRALFAEVEAVNRGFIATVRGGAPAAAFARYYDYYNGAAGAWDAVPAAARAKLVAIAEAVCRGLAAAHASPTTLADLAALAMPVVLMRGGATDRIHARIADLLAAAMPGARYETVAGAGHMLTTSHAATVAAIIADAASR